MHFREEEGIPIVRKFTRTDRDWIGTILATEHRLTYRVTQTAEVCKDSDDAYSFLHTIAAYSKEATSGFEEVPKDLHFARRSMMATFPTILEMLAKSKTKDDFKGFAVPGLAVETAIMAPIRTKPKRTYDGYAKPFSPDGEHTPYLLRKQLGTRAKAETFHSALSAFGEASGLFADVGIREFSSEPSAPFEVTVTLGEQPLRVNSVGYGVSQILPVVVELLTRSRDVWFCIQQPEVHLHPKAQAAFGDLLYTVASTDHKTLFVETHSDYVVDRYRMNYQTKRPPRPEAQVLFFERTAGGNKAHVMKLGQSGEYPDDQPEAFRSFFLQEQRQILGL